MRFLCRVTLCLTVLAIACSGDRYELSKDSRGRTVRLDKKTGEVAILETGARYAFS